MAVVPYVFANQTGQIPLFELDQNFANCKAFAVTAGTVTGNSQGNITSVGTLISLSVSGNVVAPVFVGNLVGNVSGNILAAGTNTQVLFNDSGIANAVAGMTFNKAFNSFVVTGNITGGNLRTAGEISATGNITAGNVVAGNLTGNILSSSISIGGNITGGNILSSGIISTSGNVNSQNIVVSGNVAAATLNAVGNIVGNVIQGLAFRANVGVFSVPVGVANIFLGNDRPTTVFIGGNAGNIFVGNVNSVTEINGNLQVDGNIVTPGFISATGNIIGGNIIGTIVGTISTSSVSVPGNITGGNILTGGIVSATGNITGGNVSANNLTGTMVSVTGNITGGNIRTAGSVTATGNITGAFFVGNGSALTGIVTSSNAALLTGNTLSSNVLNSSLTSVGTLTSLSVTGNVTAGNIIGSGAGTPTVSSSTDLILSSPTTVRVSGGGTFRLPNLTSAQIANLTGLTGDMVYNSSIGAVQVYTSSGWQTVSVF